MHGKSDPGDQYRFDGIPGTETGIFYAGNDPDRDVGA